MLRKLAPRRVIQQLKLLSTLGAACLLTLGMSFQAKADVVTFSGLVNGQTSYTEAGMTVAAPPGGFLIGTAFGTGGSRTLSLGNSSISTPVTFTFSGGAFDAQSIETNYFPSLGPGLSTVATFTAFSGTTQTGMVTLTRVFGDPNPALVLSFGSGFQGITSFVLDVGLSGSPAGQIAVDNFTFQPAQGPGPGPEPVPEPTTLILLGTGLVGIRSALRKRRNKDAK